MRLLVGSDSHETSLDLCRVLPVPVIVVELDGSVLWANPEFAQTFSHEVGDSVFGVDRLIDPDEFAWVADMRLRILRGELDKFVSHTRMRRADGARVDTVLRATVVRIADTGRMALLASITPKEHLVGDEHNPFRRALDNQRELISEWSPDGTILYCNRSYREFFGFDESIIGQNIDQYIVWEEGNSREITLQQFEAGADKLLNTRTYADGRAVEWANTLMRSPDGSVTSVLGVGRDVGDRLAAELALRHSEERFRTMVTHIWDSILLLDANGAVMDSSAMYRTDLGYDAEFWSQANLFDLAHPDDLTAALAALETLKQGGHGAQGYLELRVRRADGSVSWLEINGSNLLDEPSVAALVLTVRNIDDRKRIERELAQRHAESQAALRQRVGFVAQVSHELRNPLHGMLGLGELLAGAPLEPRLAEASAAMLRQTRTLRRIVDDLLDVARLEVGNLRVVRDVVDLAAVVRDTIAVARDSAAPGVEVVADVLPDEVRHALGDADRVRQALANLLSNACKHTMAGEVRVRVTAGSVPDTVRISVLDTGTGIDPAEIPRLFQPYERGVSEVGDGGLGLGLAIVRGTLEAMGGSTGAAARAEGGAEFWMELPRGLGSDDTVQSERPTEATDSVCPGLRVLVIDDDPVNQLVAGFQLAEYEAVVTEAVRGDDAWQILQTQPFDVLIVDVQMPGINGLDLVRMVRAADLDTGTVPLIAIMTASATAADHLAAMDAGADMFVPKPASVADIGDVLLRRCEQQH